MVYKYGLQRSFSVGCVYIILAVHLLLDNLLEGSSFENANSPCQQSLVAYSSLSRAVKFLISVLVHLLELLFRSCLGSCFVVVSWVWLPCHLSVLQF